jgi:hypothetical protein
MTTRDKNFTYEGQVKMPAGTLTVQGDSAEAVDQAVDAFKRSQERESFRRKRWGKGGVEGMERLCALFPSLRSVPGTKPWSVDHLMEWLTTGAPTSGSRHAAMFVLGVWNPQTDWSEIGREMFPPSACERCGGSGYVDDEGRPTTRGEPCIRCDGSGRFQPTVPARFDLFGALAVWDDAHHAAFLQWVEAPFWP